MTDLDHLTPAERESYEDGSWLAAEQRSFDADVIADARRFGLKFCSIDQSIRLHATLAITEPWNEWEWPRRLAAIRLEGQRMAQGRLL